MIKFLPTLSLFGIAALMAISCSQQQNSTTMTDAEVTTSVNVTATGVHYVEKAEDVTPPLTGTQIPNPQLRTTEGDTVHLMNVVSQQPTVLIFYRGGWCPYCSKHMAELQQAEDKLVQMGYQILAISPDRPQKLQESIAEHNLTYTLLSDSPMETTSAFGLAFKVDEQTLKRYDGIGIDLKGSSGYSHHLLPVPAVFLVDTNGIIQFQYVNPNYQTRINSNVLLTAAQEYYPGKN